MTELLVFLMECVEYSDTFSFPNIVIHFLTIREYWNIERGFFVKGEKEERNTKSSGLFPTMCFLITLVELGESGIRSVFFLVFIILTRSSVFTFPDSVTKSETFRLSKSLPRNIVSTPIFKSRECNGLSSNSFLRLLTSVSERGFLPRILPP